MSDKNFLQEKEQKILPLEDVSNVYFGYLKPYGKIEGNNIFTFHRPNMEELSNTLRSFPQPVYWLTHPKFSISNMAKGLLKEVKVISFSMQEKMASEVAIVAAQLIDFLKEKAGQKAMIVISCSEEEERIYGAELEKIILSLK